MFRHRIIWGKYELSVHISLSFTTRKFIGSTQVLAYGEEMVPHLNDDLGVVLQSCHQLCCVLSDLLSVSLSLALPFSLLCFYLCLYILVFSTCFFFLFFFLVPTFIVLHEYGPMNLPQKKFNLQFGSCTH